MRGVISVSSLPLNHNRLHKKVLCHSSTLRHEPLAFGSIPRQCSKVDRISLLSTLETQNHPVNTALSTCQPSNTPRPEKKELDDTGCQSRACVSPDFCYSPVTCYVPLRVMLRVWPQQCPMFTRVVTVLRVHTPKRGLCGSVPESHQI